MFAFCHTHVENLLKGPVSSIAPLENEVSTSIKCSVSSPDNYACSSSNGGVTPYLIKGRL